MVCFVESQRNPVKVLKRIGEVKSDFEKIRGDVAEIQKLQLDTLTQVRAEFDKMLSSLKGLDQTVLQTEVS